MMSSNRLVALGRGILIGLEKVLDTLLDNLLTYKYLAEINADQIFVPNKFYFDYVLNQKKQRVQLFQKMLLLGVDRPKTIRAWWPRSHYTSNFGDLLTHYVLAGVAGIDCIYDHRKSFLAVGSIIRSANNNSIVWGSGIIRAQEIISSNCICLSVRGPLTRERVIESGKDCPSLYGDPAMLIPIFYKPKPKYPKSPILVAPHFRHAHLLYQLAGCEYLNVTTKSISEIENCIDTIYSAKCVVTSSLHVFIMCVCYEIPVTVFQLANKSIHGDNIKFSDFCLGVRLEPVRLHYIDELDETTLDILLENQSVHVAQNWDPSPMLKALYKHHPTQLLRQNIDSLSEYK